MSDVDRTSNERDVDPGECSIATEIGMRMAQQFHTKNGRTVPLDDIEFAGMLGIAFMLGRASIAGRVK